MKKLSPLDRTLTILTLGIVLTFGLFVSIPEEVSATPELSKDGTCTQCHPEENSAKPTKPGEPAQPAQPAQPAEPSKPSKPSEPAKPAEATLPAQSSDHAKPSTPEPAEPAGNSEAQEVNNTFPIVGLAGSVIVIGGAAYLDRRKNIK